MGMLAKSLKHSIWYASKILHGTRYAEQNKEVRGTPWGEGGIASILLSTWDSGHIDDVFLMKTTSISRLEKASLLIRQNQTSLYRCRRDYSFCKLLFISQRFFVGSVL